MSNLTEKDQWEDGIYQLETSDPVLGGPDGVVTPPFLTEVISRIRLCVEYAALA